MSRNHLVPVVSVACCLTFAFLGVADDARPSNAVINELHSEKLLLLNDIVSRYEFAYSKGRPVFEELLAAKHDLLYAKLAIADSHDDRLKLLELIVENRHRLVETRIAAYELGHITEVEILAARLGYIDAKIDLQHEGSGDRGSR